MVAAKGATSVPLGISSTSRPQGTQMTYVPVTVAGTINSLEKEENLLFSRLSVQLNAMAEIIKKAKTESCKVHFSKL